MAPEPDPGSRLRRVRHGLVALAAAVLIGGWGGYAWLEARSRCGDMAAAPLGQGLAIDGHFALTDQNGQPRTDRDFQGKLVLLYFGYTYCPDVCPTTLLSLAEALDALGPAADKVQPIFISIDPERDTPAALAGYVSLFSPRLIGLTGSADQVAAAARSFGVYYRKVTPEGMSDYLMDHSAIVYLIGPDGKGITHFAHDTSAAAIAARLAQVVAGADGTRAASIGSPR